MEKVSNRIKLLADSQTLAMSQKSKDMQAEGIDVINLSVGEPDFFTPPHVKEAAKKAIDDNFSFYAPVPGYPDLRKAISEKFKRENGMDYKPEQIIVSNGAKHSIANALMCLVDDGDEVIVLSPYWVSYVELVKLAGGKNVIVEAGIDKDFKVTADQIEAAITPKTKVLMLCSPSNPTGSVYSKEELKAIADVLAKHPDIFVISDEIYEHINYVGKHESIAQFESVRDRVVLINGVSKGYAMTGWRIGYLAAPLWIAKACNKLQGQFTSGASSIAQKASVAALSGDNSYTEKMKEAFERRRNLMVDKLDNMEGVKVNKPQGAFYVFPDISHYFGKSYGDRKINDSGDFCFYILEEAHVACVPGAAFGAPNYARLSYATSDEKLTEALNRIEKALAKLA